MSKPALPNGIPQPIRPTVDSRPAATPAAAPAPPTAIVASGISPPTLGPASVRVESELRDLREGELYLFAPKSMQVDDEEIVEARAGYLGDPALGANASAKGVPRIFDLTVSRVMRAKLSGERFKVEALTDEDQPFEGVGVVTWRWRVVPNEPGTQRLHLEVAAIVRSDGRERGRSVGGVDHFIEVQVTPRWFFGQTTSIDWKSIGAALAALGGAAAGVWGLIAKLRGRRRRARVRG